MLPEGGFPLLPVRLRQGADDPAGIPSGHHPGRDVPGDNGPGGNDGPLPDGNAGENHHIAPNPHIVLNGDGAAVFQIRVPHLRHHGVVHRVDADPGGDVNPAADGDGGDVQEDKDTIFEMCT